MKRAATLLCLLISLLAILTTACDRPAQGHTVAASRLSPNADERPFVCGFRFDGTRSQAPELFTRTAKTISQEMETAVDTFQCTAVRLTLWSDDGGFAPTQEFRIPDELLRAPVAKPEPKRPDITEQFAPGRKLRAEQQEKAATDRKKAIEAARGEMVRAARKWIADNVRQVDRPCTAVRDFIEAIDAGITVANIDIVVTDAQETCNASPASALVLRHPVVFVIVPTVGDIHHTAAIALQTAKALDHLYVNSESVMAYELDTPTVWAELKQRLAAKAMKKEI